MDKLNSCTFVWYDMYDTCILVVEFSFFFGCGVFIYLFI